MEILWRNDEYDFQPRVLEGGTDNVTKFSNIDGLIFGADTESVQKTDRYEVQCLTLSSKWEDHITYTPEHDDCLKTHLMWFIELYGETCLNHDIPHHFMYWHNLEYDWLQLCKTDEVLLEMARVGVSPDEDFQLFKEQGWTFTMKKNSLFSGSAPFVKIRCGKGRRRFTLYLYDTFSFFPAPLSKLAGDLGLDVEKLDRQEDLGKRDFRLEGDSEEKTYFEEYAKIDAKVTRLTGEKIRELHQKANMTKIRPSAPAYAINLLFHGMDEGQIIKTGSYDPNIMQLIFDTYRGGRTGGIVHGEVQGVSVLDFHSSYPASMLSLPSFNENMQYIELDDLSLENVTAILEETGNAFLRVSGTETDPHYPTLLDRVGNKLTPVYGDFDKIATTGYELLVGIKSGSLTNLTIHECVVCVDLDEEPNKPFKTFAQNAYTRKSEAEKGSVEYASAKLALNASYGKLIESRTQTMVGANVAKDYYPFLEGLEKDFGNHYYEKHVEAMKHGQTLADIRDSVIDELLDEIGHEAFEDCPQKMFMDFSISGKIYGRNVVPAGASLITGCSRARLLVAMKALGALYWDTDSVFIPDMSEEDVNDILDNVTHWLPPDAVPVKVGDNLGGLDFEMVNGSGYLAGVKRYHLEDEEGTKQATHGIPALPKELTRDVIHSLATGQNFNYESKPRPLKAKEAKRVEDIGSFRQLKYVSQFHLDDRLTWEAGSSYWIGRVKPLNDILYDRNINDEDQERLETLMNQELKKHDPIMDGIKQEGYIQCVQQGDFYYHEYKQLPNKVKRKYFRRSSGALPVDVWCEATGYEINELFQKLGG